MKPTIIISISVFYLLLLVGCSEDGKPDLRETYDSKDYKPFGANIFYSVLQKAYPAEKIFRNKKPFNILYNESRLDTAVVYISISRQLYLQEEALDALSNFIYEGNTAFISASFIDTNLLSKFDIKQQQNPWLSILSNTRYTNTSVHLSSTPADTAERFSYFYRGFDNFFVEINPVFGRAIGFNDSDRPNMTLVSWGKGRLFLHCEPRALSNYFLLTGQNIHYARKILQWINPSPGSVVWDDYYNKIMRNDTNNKSFSTFEAIMKYPSLAFAFWIAVLLLILYIIFVGKRRQRIIPVMTEQSNSSIEFTEAIARLYLLGKNNKNIAEKMITYFNDHIRTNYFLNVHYQDKMFLTALTKKSGVSQELVEALFYNIQVAQDSTEISDETLWELNAQIQQFYKKRK